MVIHTLRRGLPRIAGGEAWPPVAEVDSDIAPVVNVVSEPLTTLAAVKAVEAPVVAEADIRPRAAHSAPTGAATQLRRGLPRLAGGAPWPPAGVLGAVVPTCPVSSVNSSLEPATGQVRGMADIGPVLTLDGALQRRGLPRISGGDQWPPEVAVPAGEVPTVAALPEANSEPEAETEPVPKATPEASPKLVAMPAPVQPGAPARPAREPKPIGSRTLSQWAKLGVLGALGAVVAAGIIVLAARGVTTLPGVPEFLKRYPGEYHLPEFVDSGFPAWARWTHFLNFFLMILIIRTGWQVRTQQKPPAFFTPKRGGKKISINLWLHTSVDVLWLANGVVFVVLLFVSGHWARIVPTSWEVFPNAVAAMLQYLTLEWPVENGWVNYNSLQQLMYFTIVFIAAPLAAITGVRMSEWWPEKAERLNKLYPAPVARAIHFPTMLFFVLFILIHVFLVLSTGALRNLNHMFGGTDVVNWAGFWWFALGLGVTAGVTIAAKPLVIAPIASLFGKVSNR